MEPYLPEPLPLTNLDWAGHIESIALANRHLARFDGLLQTMPADPQLLLAPIMTQEAVLSSRIEGTQATLEDILEYDAEPSEKIHNYQDVQEVDNYRKALTFAISKLPNSPITLNLMKEMHKILLDGVRGNNKRRGEFRTTQNWIGRPGSTLEQATFVPPSPLDLPDYLSQFEHYIHHSDRERLVQLAVIHAQFELLHPFLDGNGRIGRLLVPLFLYEKGLIAHPSFYISQFFEAERDVYYDRLENISKRGEWDAWVDFFLRAVISQAKSQTELVKEVLSLHEKMKRDIANTTKSHFAMNIIDFIFVHPVFKQATFIQSTGIPSTTAYRLLGILAEHKILLPLREKTGRAGQIYRFMPLLHLLKNGY